MRALPSLLGKALLVKALPLVALLLAPAAQAESVRLVVGSFESPQRASAWGERVELEHGLPTEVARQPSGMHRVLGPAMVRAQADDVSAELRAQGVSSWPLRIAATEVATATASASATATAAGPATRLSDSPALRASEPVARVAAASDPDGLQASGSAPEPEPLLAALGSDRVSRSAASRRAAPIVMTPVGARDLDLQLGLESRSFAERGVSNQSSWHPSISLLAEFYASTASEEWSFTASPFARFDLEDSERSHVDLREFFVTRVGSDWEVHAGVRQVFWGVTEFSHLVDIVNQTDLVENIDAEDKLGQPMISASIVRDWGIVDVFALLGHRERTFPGQDGRLRTVLPVDTDLVAYDDDREDRRIDAAVRWSQSLGALDIGVYHFSGTSREPILEPIATSSGLALRPRYTTIDQTGVDAQVLVGDTALKLEAMRRSGFGDSYLAANVGFEHTLIGVFGSRSDLGLVAEYLFDDRGDDAFNTVFERDIALGTRWQLNDAANTHALLGVIWDPQTRETQVSLEAARQLGEGWSILFEGRAFGGAPAADPASPLPALLDPDAKLSSFVQDDYVHLELVRYF